MRSSESIASIAPALILAQAEFRGVSKSGRNEYDRYDYANLEDYVRAVQPVLSAHGLSVLTSVSEVVTLPDRTTQKGGTEHAVRVHLAVRILHTSGEWMDADAWGEGQDRADKALYKAITGGRKYALASVLGLATTDDPEADETTGQTTGPQPRQQRTPSSPRQQLPQQAPRQPAPPPAQTKQPRQTAPPGPGDGEGCSDTGEDDLSDPVVFAAALNDAFLNRGFVDAEQVKATDAALAFYKVKTTADLTLEQRHAFLGSVLEGKADRYKAKAAGKVAGD